MAAFLIYCSFLRGKSRRSDSKCMQGIYSQCWTNCWTNVYKYRLPTLLNSSHLCNEHANYHSWFQLSDKTSHPNNCLSLFGIIYIDVNDDRSSWLQTIWYVYDRIDIDRQLFLQDKHCNSLWNLETFDFLNPHIDWDTTLHFCQLIQCNSSPNPHVPMISWRQ